MIARRRLRFYSGIYRLCFVLLSTGLPFKAPQQAHQPAQCYHLRLSLKRLSVSEKKQIDIPKQKQKNTAAAHPPKIAPNRSRMVQNKITEVTGFHRSFKVSLGFVEGTCIIANHAFWEVSLIGAHLSSCMRGPHLAIYKHVWLTHMLCGLMSRVFS